MPELTTLRDRLPKILFVAGSVLALVATVIVIIRRGIQGVAVLDALTAAVLFICLGLAVSLLACGLVLLLVARRRSREAAASAEDETLVAASAIEVESFGYAPVVPADQAQGFGWAKASDLVRNPRSID